MSNLSKTSAFERVAAALFGVWIVYQTFYLLRVAWPFNTDDAYITLRYSRHLAEGYGIVWNVGELPVEGYSNFLFVVLGAIALKLGVDPILFLKLLCSASLFGTCAMTYFFSRTWLGPIASIVPAYLLTSYIGTINWTVSGLETAWYQFCVCAAVFCAVWAMGYRTDGQKAEFDIRWIRASALFALIASLSRPEGPLIAILIGFAVVSHFGKQAKETKSAFKVFCLYFALPYIVYFGWRFWFFGQLLPNSVACKSNNPEHPLVLVMDFLVYAQYFILLSLVQHPRKFDARYLLCWGMTAAYLAMLYNVDPIIGYFNRHFLAVIPLILVLAVVGVKNICAWVLKGKSRFLIELPIVVIAVCWIGSVETQIVPWLKARNVQYAARMQNRQAVGQWLNSEILPEKTFVVGDSGMIPYAAKANAIDGFCLNSSAMTSAAINNDLAKFIDWIYQQQPEVLLVTSSSADELKPRPEYNFFPALVEHKEFKSNYKLAQIFSGGSDVFHYWVYRRLLTIFELPR